MDRSVFGRKRRSMDSDDDTNESGSGMDPNSESSREIEDPSEELLKVQLQYCQEVWGALMANGKHAWPFFVPVEPEVLGLTDYKRVVRYPMDLSTIGKGLKGGVYRYPNEFAGDVRRMFMNCYRYNSSTEEVTEHAWKLQVLFESKWAQIPGGLPATTGIIRERNNRILVANADSTSSEPSSDSSESASLESPVTSSHQFSESRSPSPKRKSSSASVSTLPEPELDSKRQKPSHSKSFGKKPRPATVTVLKTPVANFYDKKSRETAEKPKESPSSMKSSKSLELSPPADKSTIAEVTPPGTAKRSPEVLEKKSFSPPGLPDVKSTTPPGLVSGSGFVKPSPAKKAVSTTRAKALAVFFPESSGTGLVGLAKQVKCSAIPKMTDFKAAAAVKAPVGDSSVVSDSFEKFRVAAKEKERKEQNRMVPLEDGKAKPSIKRPSTQPTPFHINTTPLPAISAFFHHSSRDTASFPSSPLSIFPSTSQPADLSTITLPDVPPPPTRPQIRIPVGPPPPVNYRPNFPEPSTGTLSADSPTFDIIQLDRQRLREEEKQKRQAVKGLFDLTRQNNLLESFELARDTEEF